MPVNYYETLGVARDAGEREIRQAYRRLARQYHPDVNPGNAGAEEKFKEINEAHAVLSDAEKRRKYDKYGDRWMQADHLEQAEAQAQARRRAYQGAHPYSDDGQVHSGGLNFDFIDSFSGDWFGKFMGGLGFDRAGQQTYRAEAPRAEYPVEVTLAEAAEGATRLVDLPDGRRLEVTIPAGVDNGSRVHIPAGGGRDGDFYLAVSVMEHPRFERQGKDLFVVVEAPLTDLALGAEVTVPTLQGQVALTIPPGTQNGRRFRLAGQGLPELNRAGIKGSLFATIKAVLPTNLTPEETELFRKLKELRSPGRE